MIKFLMVVVAFLYSLVVSKVGLFATKELSFFVLTVSPVAVLAIIAQQFQGKSYGKFDASLTYGEFLSIIGLGIIVVLMQLWFGVLVAFGLSADALYFSAIAGIISVSVVLTSTMPALVPKLAIFAYQTFEFVLLFMLGLWFVGYNRGYWPGAVLFNLMLMGMGRLLWKVLKNWKEWSFEVSWALAVILTCLLYWALTLNVHFLWYINPREGDWNTSLTVLGLLAFFAYTDIIFNALVNALLELFPSGKGLEFNFNR